MSTPLTRNRFKKKQNHTCNNSKKQTKANSNDFIVINKFIKLDLKSNVLLSNEKIDSGSRILIELPLFKIGRPTQTSHPGNSLFLYHSFINNLNKDLQKEILYQKYPLKKLNKNIREHTQNLKTLVKKNNKLNDKSVIKYNNKQWKEIEILQNIFHSYSISLQLLSDPYHVVYDHYNNIRFNNNNNNDTNNNNNNIWDNVSDDTDHIIQLGKGLYERASLLSHSCSPCCRINVIDEKGTIEIRTLIDIPSKNIPLTRNFLDDTRGLGIMNGNKNDEFTRVLMNDDINLIPCNLRCKLLLNNYYFICQCPKCIDWDRTRGFLCSNASNSNGCKGELWSRPPYLLWKCQSCNRLLTKDNLFNVLKLEKTFINRLKGIEEIINYNISKHVDINVLLYPLLNECNKYLSYNHWIIQRLLWICFEEKLSRNYLPHALIYCKRHIEGAEILNNYIKNPSIIMANKYELISDLLPYNEGYKQEAIKKAIKLRQLLHGKDHSSVKRCINKLRFYKDKYQK
eukprot:273294_1